MGVVLFLILKIAVFEDSEGVDKGIMAFLIPKVEILVYRIEDVSVVLLQLSKRIAGIHTLANRDHKLGCVGYHSALVFVPESSFPVVAFGLELDVSSALS
jgi:hypothetical protein